jgi:hypothetical protein
VKRTIKTKSKQTKRTGRSYEGEKQTTSPSSRGLNILHRAQLGPPGGPSEIINSSIRKKLVYTTAGASILGQVGEAQQEPTSGTSTFDPLSKKYI